MAENKENDERKEQIAEMNKHIREGINQWADIMLTADADQWAYDLRYFPRDLMNATFIFQHVASNIGIKKVRIIETTGDELVAVKRTDIDIDSAEGRKMALLDNLTTQVNLAWDPTEIDAVSSEIEGFDPSDYGFDPSQLEVA